MILSLSILTALITSMLFFKATETKHEILESWYPNEQKEIEKLIVR